MSRYDRDGELMAWGRILVEYTDKFNDDVYAAMRYRHEAEGWGRPDD